MAEKNLIKEVPKKWGKELWLANNSLYCGKILEFNEGARCSNHYHKIKDETFYVLDGVFNIMIDEIEHITLVAGDSLRIRPNTKHKIENIGKSSGRIVEISTQHFEEDSYRLDASAI